MSFLKKLFEKKKHESKYGQGHRLGDAKQNEAAMTSRGDAQQPASMSLRSNNEAAMRAAEAAMQRMQTKNSPRPNTATGKGGVQGELESEDREMRKALELKDHYFGKPKLVEAAPLVKKNRIFYKSDVLPAGQRYTKEEIENRIEQTLLEQMESDPILAAVTLLYTANHKQADKLTKCKETLNKIADNIINNPNEDKYRKMRIENKVFSENVYSLKYAQILLSNVGFETRRMPVKEDEPDVQEDFYVFEKSADVAKLEALKSALALAEPVLPELDRDIKIFKPSSSSESSTYNFRDEYDIDDFFNVKVEDMIKEQQARNDLLEKSGMLRTKAMRERDEQLELRRYMFCLVRVKFPDNYVLEALFRTNETLGDLYELIGENLAHDGLPFELVGPSLKKPSSPETTLAAAGLAPASLLYFKICELANDEIAGLDRKIKNYLKF